MVVGGDVLRERLMHRLLSPDVRFITLFATAGYGKSTLARQYAQHFRSVAVCDFRGAQTLRDVAQKIAVALAPDPSVAAQAAAPIDADAEIFLDFTHYLWTREDGPDLVVFENAEILRRIDAAEHRLSRLLAVTPASRRACICSRAELDLQFVDFALPHEVVALREPDLAFDPAELADFLEKPQTDAHAFYDLTRGWPLCVRLVARLAETRSVDTIVQELRSLEFSLLYEYLLRNVIAALTPLGRSVAIALAAADLTNDDLRRIFAEDVPAARAIAESSPFISRQGLFWTLHPLVRASLQRNFPDETHRALSVAALAALSEEPVRAAVLYAQASDFEAAATALEPLALAYVSEAGIADFAIVLQQIPQDVLLRHPRLFASAMTFAGLGITNEQRYRDAYAIRQRFVGTEDEATRTSIDVTIANALANLGRHEEAAEYVARFESSPDERERILYCMLYGGIRARMGRFEEAMRLWEPLKALARDAPSTLAFGANEIAVRAARSRGDFAAEREYQSFALINARKSGNPTAHALTLIESMFGAWLHGDDSAFSSAAAELQDLRFPSIMPGTRLFRECSEGRFDNLAPDVSRPQVHAYAYLLGLRLARGDLQRRLALLAADAADRANEPLLQCIARVAQAFVDSTASARLLAEAHDFASRVESSPLREAVAELRQGRTPAMFRAAAESITDLSTQDGRYHLRLLEPALFLGNTPLHPTNREFELLAYLAFRDREVSKDELAEVFAPNATSPDADRLIRVTVSRIRKKFGEDLVQSTPHGYMLGARVDVPLREMRLRVERAEARTTLSAGDAGALLRDAHRLRLYLAGRRYSFEWSEEFDAALEALLARMEASSNRNPV